MRFVLISILLCFVSATAATYTMDGTAYDGVTISPCEFAAGYLPPVDGVWDVPLVEIGRGSVAIENDGEAIVEVTYFQDINLAPTINGVTVRQQFLYRVDPDWHVPGEGFYLIAARVAGQITITGNQQTGSAIASVTVRDPADCNADGAVNLLDLIFIRNRLGQDMTSDDVWRADVNGDGRVDLLDLIAVRNQLIAHAPARITDLAVEHAGPGLLLLSWTVPAGAVRQVIKYNARPPDAYATPDDWWTAGTELADVPPPAAAGTRQTMLVEIATLDTRAGF